MRRPPINAQRDENEAEIVTALEQIGATVKRLSQKDIPDLIIGFRGRNFWIEIKSPGGKLKKGQRELHDRWRGQIAVCETFEECLEILLAAAPRAVATGKVFSEWKLSAGLRND